MNMGQVWSAANFDGTTSAGFLGGRGSPLAVTAQNPGPDGIWNTVDDLLTPMNVKPVEVSIDSTPGLNSADPLDRVRGFYSMHGVGAVFAFGDASTTFLRETIDPQVFRSLSTKSGGELNVDY